MESASSGILRTKSEQIEMASIKQSLSRTASAETISVADTNGGLSRKSSFGKIGSPGRRVGNHTRKSRSGQLKLELDEVSSSAALSRASSAGLGFSFSFTGFTPPEDIIANLKKSFSDDDNGKYLHSFSITLACRLNVDKDSIDSVKGRTEIFKSVSGLQAMQLPRMLK